jgi:hypothetical protein
MITTENFYKSFSELYDIDLLQDEVGGGGISYEEIDKVANFPRAKSIIISGLRQETFEYFLCKYGKQFEAITFWKNKLVEDLSSLEELENVKFISYFFNQKAYSLWDVSKNKKLVGLSITDFSKIHSISQIENANSIQYFRLGNEVFNKMEIDSLKPLMKTNITHFTWLGKTVLDEDYKCLATGQIKELNMNPTMFSLNELAEVLSSFPITLEGSITKPYIIGRVKHGEKMTVSYKLCKGRKKCIEGEDDECFKNYLKEFNDLLLEYRLKKKYSHE